MSEASPSPKHIKKYTRNYEDKLIDILVERRGMNRSDVLKQRNLYSLSLDQSKANSNPNSRFPLTVNIELLNKCNYKCSMCYTVNHDGPSVPLGVATAKLIIDECAENNLMTLFIANGSEPTISPDFRQIVSYATSKIPDVAVFTNALKLDHDMTHYLLESGITRLNISLDAATKETYRLIRGGDLDQIESNIMYFLNKRGSENPPLVRVSFVEQPDNAHEINHFISKWSNIADSVEIQCLQNFHDIPLLPVLSSAGDLTRSTIVDNNHCYSPFPMLLSGLTDRLVPAVLSMVQSLS